MEGGQGLRRHSEVREKNGWAIPIRSDESPLLYVIGIHLARKIDWLRSRRDEELPYTQMRWICKKRQYSWTILLLLLLFCII
jgi:hypothetical protein